MRRCHRPRGAGRQPGAAGTGCRSANRQGCGGETARAGPGPGPGTRRAALDRRAVLACQHCAAGAHTGRQIDCVAASLASHTHLAGQPRKRARRAPGREPRCQERRRQQGPGARHPPRCGRRGCAAAGTHRGLSAGQDHRLDQCRDARPRRHLYRLRRGGGHGHHGAAGGDRPVAARRKRDPGHAGFRFDRAVGRGVGHRSAVANDRPCQCLRAHGCRRQPAQPAHRQHARSGCAAAGDAGGQGGRNIEGPARQIRHRLRAGLRAGRQLDDAIFVGHLRRRCGCHWPDLRHRRKRRSVQFGRYGGGWHGAAARCQRRQCDGDLRRHHRPPDLHHELRHGARPRRDQRRAEHAKDRRPGQDTGRTDGDGDQRADRQLPGGRQDLHPGVAREQQRRRAHRHAGRKGIRRFGEIHAHGVGQRAHQPARAARSV